MKTMTIEPETPVVRSAGEPQEAPRCDDLDPDFTIEGTGGPADNGGGAQIGPPAQPPC